MPNFYGNTTPAIDYGSMQQAMSMGLQGQQPVNAQGPLNTQNWVKNDMLPPQYQLQDQLGKMAVQNNTVNQLSIANALQQQILAHQFGDNQMQGAQMQMLRQQIQAEQFKNQVTNPETAYQATQQDLANHAKMFQDNYGVNIGEAASDLRNDFPVTDSTGRQTTVKSGYDPSSGILYVPPKSVMNPILGQQMALPAQQVQIPLGMHMLAKEVGARQAGFDSFADMQSKYNLQTLAQAAAQLQQEKITQIGKYSSANPYGITSPDVVSNGAPTLPGAPMSPGISMNPTQFAARQAQLQQQTSQAMQRYNGTTIQQTALAQQPRPWLASNTFGASGTPDGMRGSEFNNSQSAYRPVAQLAWQGPPTAVSSGSVDRPFGQAAQQQAAQWQQITAGDGSFVPVKQNRFAQMNDLNSQPGMKNYIVNGLLPATSDAVHGLGARLYGAPSGITGWLNSLGSGNGGQYIPDDSGVMAPNYHGVLGGGL